MLRDFKGCVHIRGLALTYKLLFTPRHFVVYTEIPLLFTLRYLCCLHSDTFVVYTQTLYCLHSDTFVEDFFLTYPSFMTMSDLCEGLLERYKGREEEGTDQPNMVGREGEGRRGADTSERLRKQM